MSVDTLEHRHVLPPGSVLCSLGPTCTREAAALSHHLARDINSVSFMYRSRRAEVCCLVHLPVTLHLLLHCSTMSSCWAPPSARPLDQLPPPSLAAIRHLAASESERLANRACTVHQSTFHEEKKRKRKGQVGHLERVWRRKRPGIHQ